MMRVLVGIDDTDNKTSRGTGYLARKLARHIDNENLGNTLGISRHQLFVDSRIPYTSQNSSACLDINCANIDGLVEFTRSFLISESAPGSDVGLAVTEYSTDLEEVVLWGQRAKKEVLNQKEAILISHKSGVFLEGLTGTKDGIIGAMAGIGLRLYGNDGRFIWLKGKEIRDLNGVFSARQLMEEIAVDQIQEKSGYLIPSSDMIAIVDWLRPVIINSRVAVIVEKSNSKDYEWKIADKEFIKSISN